MEERVAKIERYMEDAVKRIDEHARILAVNDERARYVKEQIDSLRHDVAEKVNEVKHDLKKLNDNIRYLLLVAGAGIIGAFIKFVIDGGLNGG